MSVSQDGLKAYLRLPSNSTEDLSLYLSAAQERANAAGVPVWEGNALYDLFIYTLAACFYDYRGAENPPGAQEVINSFVLQLRYQEG